MMIGYLFIRIDSVGLIYDTVDVKMVVPTFIDDIGDLRSDKKISSALLNYFVIFYDNYIE